jgi:hypothetical protein
MFRQLIHDVTGDKSRCPGFLLKMDEETLSFLDTGYEHVPSDGQQRIRKILTNADQKEIESTICELVAFELLFRLELSPQFQPCIEEKTPDLGFLSLEQHFLIDVFVVHTPDSVIHDEEDNLQFLKDEEERTIGKIRQRILEKAQKYSTASAPFIPMVFFGDQLLTPFDCFQALFQGYYEISSEGEPREVNWGLFLEDVSDVSVDLRESISAVICCNWFKPVNGRYSGRLLQCLIIHNCGALIRLPDTAFERFPQLLCQNTENGAADWSHSPLTVAKFLPSGGIELESYLS